MKFLKIENKLINVSAIKSIYPSVEKGSYINIGEESDCYFPDTTLESIERGLTLMGYVYDVFIGAQNNENT
jgi:hypothetical protein